jgi:hypothetical protein
MGKRTWAAVGLALLCIGGCTNYYKVTDPTTGKVYYTTQLQEKTSGAATLKDGRTGSQVNLQNSVIEKITKESYEAGKNAPAPAPAEPSSGQTNAFK